MSYARFGKDSDVYVFGHINDREGEVRCCACKLPFITKARGGFYEQPAVNFIAEGPTGMVLHLEEHVEAGHDVPKRAFTRLRKEAVERSKKPIIYPVHLAVRRRKDFSWKVPLCGYAWSAHSRRILGAKYRREHPDGHAHPRDETTTNPKRVTCSECKKRMRVKKQK